jgi:hypothetical protein
MCKGASIHPATGQNTQVTFPDGAVQGWEDVSKEAVPCGTTMKAMLKPDTMSMRRLSLTCRSEQTMLKASVSKFDSRNLESVTTAAGRSEGAHIVLAEPCNAGQGKRKPVPWSTTSSRYFLLLNKCLSPFSKLGSQFSCLVCVGKAVQRIKHTNGALPAWYQS